MDRRTFVTAMTSMLASIAGVDAARADDEDHRLDRLYSMTTTLVLKYYPDAKTGLRQQTIHFESRTRRFMVHEQLKTGEWQDAYETIGDRSAGVWSATWNCAPAGILAPPQCHKPLTGATSRCS